VVVHKTPLNCLKGLMVIFLDDTWGSRNELTTQSVAT
jgi:hypothetical protein